MNYKAFRSYGLILFLPLFSIFFISAWPAAAQQTQVKKPRTETRTLDQEQDSKTDSSRSISRNVSKVKKVMITDFDARGVVRWWAGNWDIGSLFANSIIGPMSRSEGYEVVERARMKEVFDELNLSESERFSQTSVTKAGRQLGADYILFGFLSDFTRKKSGFGPYKEVTARIAFSARLVDVATGKVIKSTEINYISPKQREVSLTAGDEFNPNDPEFLQSLFGKAINESARNLVTQLTGETTNQTTAQNVGGGSPNNSTKAVENVASVATQAKVADVTGNSITINRGRQHGVREGQFFAIVKVVKEIKDPETGKVISQKTEELARLKITSIEGSSAEGTLVSGDIKLFNFGTEVVRVDVKK